MLWNELYTGLGFGLIVILLFLAAHFVALALMSIELSKPLTPEQEAMLAALLEQPK